MSWWKILETLKTKYLIQQVCEEGEMHFSHETVPSSFRCWFPWHCAISIVSLIWKGFRAFLPFAINPKVLPKWSNYLKSTKTIIHQHRNFSIKSHESFLAKNFSYKNANKLFKAVKCISRLIFGSEQCTFVEKWSVTQEMVLITSFL